MKKKKLITKLSLGKKNISNLGSIHGGYVTAPVLCETANCGTNNCGTNNCGTNNCGSNLCYTNAHPASDPQHCRTCHNWG
ncbi:hypothetical protein [Kordia sp.]|uniref:hypothetical protein n=1 Tax=Kordia sp. TaxID=1965332 RepID=UPI003B5C0CB6